MKKNYYRASKLTDSCCVGSMLPVLPEITVVDLAFTTLAIIVINIFNNNLFFLMFSSY